MYRQSGAEGSSLFAGKRGQDQGGWGLSLYQVSEVKKEEQGENELIQFLIIWPRLKLHMFVRIAG
jgi:hypothetical protein